MGKLTISLITKKGSLNAPKYGRDNKEHLSSLTHLYLQDNFIDVIGDIATCKNLKVLYLQNNQIEKIENLDFASNLTHLYLQRNKLKKIQGLEKLYSLRKLYLGYNEISVVESLENQHSLQEMHLERQQLNPGEELHFDPRSVAALRYCLQVLNLQGNNLTSLTDLGGLTALQTLNVASNKINDVLKVESIMRKLPNLLSIDLRENPISTNYRNCNKIIASSCSLDSLNGKQISNNTRQFIHQLEHHRLKSQTSLINRTFKQKSEINERFEELSQNLPEAIARDVKSSILKNVAAANSEEIEVQFSSLPESKMSILAENSYHHFPAFKSSTSNQLDGHFIPAPFRHYRNLGPQPRRRTRSPATLPSQISPPFLTKLSNRNQSHKRDDQNVTHMTEEQNLTSHGDTICEIWASDDVVKGTIFDAAQLKNMSLQNKE